jgi:hypothetical protein
VTGIDHVVASIRFRGFNRKVRMLIGSGWFAMLLSFLVFYVPMSFGQTAPQPIPLINNPVVPTSAPPGGAGFTLTVNGTGFASGATIDWNGSPRTTAFVSSSQLTATINAADIAVAGTASVTVVNPPPGGGTSNVIFFTVRNPAASISFANATNSPITVGNNPISVAVGDFNDDGIQDLVIANDGSNSVTILLGNGDGTFTAAATPPGTFSGPDDIVVGDFNGDGKLDLAILNGGSNSVTILLGTGNGTFFVPDVDTSSTGSNPLSMVAGDFNRDGNLDLAVANYRSDNVTILLGNGDGSFTTAEGTPATGSFPAQIVAGDFNNDGKLDLAVDNQCGTGDGCNGTVTILLGDGTGNFTPTQNSPATGSGPVSMAVADFNGDGNLDLAIPSDCGASGTCTSNGAVTILLGDGEGNFTAGTSMAATGLRPYGIVVGDFNGDGKVDLAIANNDSNTVTILLGDGTGNFVPIASPPATGPGPVFPAIGDFNNDGLMDVAVANLDSNTVSVLMQVGVSNNVTLTVTPAGNGTGTVSSVPAGIDCGETCSSSFASGTVVTLTATPADGSTFVGWGAGPCEGTGTCTFTITSATTVVANFALSTNNNFTLTVNEAGTGSGTVTSVPSGISCPTTCSASFASGTQVTLTASAATGSTFAGWSGGGCTGTGTCVVTVTAATAVTAMFNSGSSPVTIGIGQGSSSTVTTSPGSSAVFGLVLTALPGTTGTVQLTCTSPVASITCSIVPSSITLTGKAINVAIVVETFCKGSVPNFLPMPGAFGTGLGLLLATLCLSGVAWTYKKQPRWALSFGLLIIFAVGMTACSNVAKSPSGSATPPGNYPLVVTATAPNGATSSVSLTLKVQ